MEANTTSGRIEYGVSQQVISIHEHRRNHDQPGLLPIQRDQHPCNKARKQKMESVVYYRLEYKKWLY